MGGTEASTKKKINFLIVNIILPISILFFFSLLLIYVFYKSEIFFGGALREFYIKYYIIGIIGFLFSIIVFFLKENFKKNLFLFIFAILISLYLLESALSIQNLFLNKTAKKINQKKEEIYFKKTGKKYDFRSAYEVVSAPNSGLEFLIQPEFFWDSKDDIFPLSGKPNSKILLGNENGYYAYYLSDKYGFNNPNEVWQKKQTKYLLLGDSFVHGFAVNSPDDIASQLRILSGENVINLGFGGNGPLTSYATLKEFYSGSVENILWFYFEGNDLTDLIEEKQNKILLKYLNDESYFQNLKSKNKIINIIFKNYTDKQIKIAENYEKRKNKFLRFILLWNFRAKINLLASSSSTKTDKTLDDSLNTYLEIITKINSFSRRNNSKLYFILIPEFKRHLDGEPSNSYSVKLIEFLKKNKIEFIDLHNDFFSKYEDPLEFYPFRMRGHFNEYGYKKISKYIYDFIR